jgi:hypothetical protein
MRLDNAVHSAGPKSVPRDCDVHEQEIGRCILAATGVDRMQGNGLCNEQAIVQAASSILAKASMAQSARRTSSSLFWSSRTYARVRSSFKITIVPVVPESVLTRSPASMIGRISFADYVSICHRLTVTGITQRYRTFSKVGSSGSCDQSQR